MLNLLFTIFIIYYFYRNSIKTGKFKIFLGKILPEIINSLQDVCDKIEGRKTKRYANNRWKQSNDHMSVEEAKQILGVKHGASNEEIMKAFKKLMLINHPDKGGSEYIAAKVIQAKETLIKNK